MRPAVAVELSERWLKILVGKPSVRGTQASQCLVKPIQGLADEQVTQVVSATLKELKLKPRSVMLCLPRNLVTVRNLHLPSQEPKEIAQMIDLNIVRMVPYRKEEVVSSYRLLGVDDIGYAKVMLAIVHREMIKRHVGVLEAAGLSVERVTLSSSEVWRWAVTRQADDLTPDDLLLVIDVDAAFTDFLLCSRQELFFSRSIAIDAEQLAEEAGLARLLNEVNQSLEIFQNEEMNRRPTKALVGGADAVVAMVERAAQEDLKLPVKRLPGPLAPATKSAGPASGPLAMCSLSATAQLLSSGPHDMSFVLPEIQIRQSLREKARELFLAGSLGIYLLTLVVGFFLSRLYHQQTYLRQLHERNGAIEQEIGDLVNQSRRIEVVKNYLTGRELPLRYLAELQKLIPDEVALDFMSVDEQQRGVIRGQARQLSDVFKLITALENSRFIEQVDTKYTRRKKVRDHEVTEFELSLKVHLG